MFIEVNAASQVSGQFPVKLCEELRSVSTERVEGPDLDQLAEDPGVDHVRILEVKVVHVRLALDDLVDGHVPDPQHRPQPVANVITDDRVLTL